MENKRLMILGTNEYQNPVIVRAKELGYETHVYGLQRGEIGEKTADFFHPVDVCDFERMWAEVGSSHDELLTSQKRYTL